MKSILLFILTLLGQILSAQTFTEVLDTPFEDAAYGSIAFSDVDGDNDPDVLITGENSLGDVFAKLYTNEGGRWVFNRFVGANGHAKYSIERIERFIKLTDLERDIIRYHMGMYAKKEIYCITANDINFPVQFRSAHISPIFGHWSH